MIKLLYKKLLKPILFKLDPEQVHNGFTRVGKLLGSNCITKLFTRALFKYRNPRLKQNIAGLEFQNPVGLSAGFDKNGQLTKIMSEIGFGFMQVGTVTYKPYEGNPKPRVYRLPKSKALVVYYGLKNIGIKNILRNLVPVSNFQIGISIGKTNCQETASTEAGIRDYVSCLQEVIKSGQGDFYTLNVSCPNTFGGEPFTTPDKLDSLLKEIQDLKPPKPLFIKMPLSYDWQEFNELLKVAIKYKVDGVIIANLEKNRANPKIIDEIPEQVKGSISGKPTFDLSNELIKKTYKKYGNDLTIVGVGGIFSAEDAYEKGKSGASLVQLITGMIYEGPQLIGEINRGLVKLLDRDGYKTISEAVGTAAD